MESLEQLLGTAGGTSHPVGHSKAVGIGQGDHPRAPTSPVSSFSSVDFPAPLGPTRATRVSRSIPNSKLL